MSPDAVPCDRAWVSERRGSLRLYLAPELAGRVTMLGLDRPWELVAPRPPGPGTGRGAAGVVQPAQGPALFVKRCRRGGLPARWNPDRYFSTHRFRRELAVSARAREAGLPVGETLAVILRRARPGWHAWSVARFIEDATDLARALSSPLSPGSAREQLRAAGAAVVAVHCGGLRHPDLNLGNIVVRACGAGACEAFVVDLDRARWLGRPLGRSGRRRARARLERSWRKVFAAAPPVGDDELVEHLLDPVERGAS